MNVRAAGRPMEMRSAEPVVEEPVVADTIIFATDPLEAKRMAESLGLAFEEVQWYRSAALLGNVDVSDRDVKFTPAFTHRADYAEARERVKLKTGVGRRRSPQETGRPETAGRTAV